MIGPKPAGSSFTAYASGFLAGLAGQITVRLEDSDGNLLLADTTADIVEIDEGGTYSVYRYTGTHPAEAEWVIIWTDPDGIEAAEDGLSGAAPTAESDGPTLGPCETWITGADVADACADVTYASDNQDALDRAAVSASMLLFEATARQFTGMCTRTVRPCRTGCGCWAGAAASGWAWGYGAGGWRWWNDGCGDRCGCAPLSEVLLSGYPVRSVTEVLIDGDVIDPSEYRLDGWRRLVRLADADGHAQRWPGCQRLDLAATEEGTFQITYLHGIAPPPLGEDAAAALACELYRATPQGGGDCALPSGVTRVVRQGVTVDLVPSLAGILRKAASGIPAVDLFVAAYNGAGLRRRAAIWSPDLPPYARRVGT